MAWSPIRRANAGSFEVGHPGDYATLNSNQLRDGTVAPTDKLSVVLVALFGVMFLGERLSATSGLGIALIAAGAILVAWKS
jgi:uncharacterized membrane protein